MAGVIDPGVVARCAALQIVITVPPSLVVNALRRDDIGAESNLWLVAAFFALIVAPAVAGAVAGRRRPDAPMLHAALATAAGWAVLAALGLLRSALAADELAPVLATLLTIAPIQVGIGVLGAFFGRPRSAEEIEP